jgi:hypothetical protein
MTLSCKTNYLNEFVRILIECSPDSDALLLLHGDVLLEVPALDDLDGGEDHVLPHPQVLLLPKGDHAVVVTLQFLSGVDGFLI